MLCLASKIGPDFSKKVKLPKNHFNKKCAPKLLFFNEKKIRKICMIFIRLLENWVAKGVTSEDNDSLIIRVSTVNKRQDLESIDKYHSNHIFVRCQLDTALQQIR